MKGDYKSDPDCRSGMFANFKSNSKCVFARRLAIIDGKERRYRMVLLNSGNFCFQLATDLTATDSDEEDDDEEEDGEEEDQDDDAPAPAPAPKGRKRKEAPKEAPEKPPPEAEEEAGSSTGGRPKRQRKQVAK